MSQGGTVPVVFSAISRNDPSPASHGDSQFQFLDRVSGPYWDQVRDLIEDWFSRLCSDAQADVRGRLRSRDDRQFDGAFFELYVHECLLRMGYTVTCHPEPEGSERRPDFLAEKNRSRMYVEARSASTSDVSVGAAARLNTVYQSLDRLDSPNFFLWIDVERQGDAPFAAKPLRRRLETWLAGLDPDDYPAVDQRRDLPELRHESGGWAFTFNAIPKSRSARGEEGVRPLGIFGGREAHWVHNDAGIRAALADKGSAYGSLGAPFVVAVATSSLSMYDHDVRNALYGTEVVQISLASDGASTWARKPDGYWYAGTHWAHRGVSAVLVAKQLHPTFNGSQTHTLWEHPDPEFPVDELPIWRRSTVEDGNLTVVDPQRSQADWFGLGDPWPVGEAFAD